LSTTADGSRADLFTSDDDSGRQKWMISQAINGDWYNIKVMREFHPTPPHPPSKIYFAPYTPD